MTRTGGVLWRSGKPYVRVRLGKNERPLIALACQTEAAITERVRMVAEVADEMVDAGLAWQAKATLQEIGAAPDARAAERVRIVARRLVANAGAHVSNEVTVAELAKRWTSGVIAREWPDRVKVKRSAKKDAGIFRMYVNPIIGRVPVSQLKLVHAESVMGSLDASLSSAMRRHVAQCMSRLITIAVYPLKLLPVSPLPRGFLPPITDRKAKSYLFPDEEAALLANAAIPLAMRVLYGLLAREGLRVSEALALDWSDLELTRGMLVLDENKTDDPRAWALRQDVTRALAAWKGLSPVKPFDLPREELRHQAEALRGRLEQTGIQRAQLFEHTASRLRVRVHDLRATFVTLALAHGKSDVWVRDRTGHRSATILETYRRAARTAAELQVGELLPLDEAVPELTGKKGRKRGPR